MSALSVYFPRPMCHGSGPIRVACVGDSITYGYGVAGNRETDSYPAILSRLLGEEYRVMNYGACNRTAIDRYPLSYRWTGFEGKALRWCPNLVLVLLGANDARPEDWDPERFRSDYKKLLRRYLDVVGPENLYLLYPTEVYGDVGRNSNIQGPQREILTELAAELGCWSIDLCDRSMGRPELFPDGLHPNTEGNAVIAQTTLYAIKGGAK